MFLFDHTDFSVTTISDPYEGMRLNNFLVKTVLPHSSVLVLFGTDHGGINIVDKYKKQVRYLLNPKYALDILLRAEIALKSATSLLFSISP